MPTGYTAAVQKGISFEEYALSCAKAFGACITLRDSPADTEIPDEFEAGTFNRDALVKAKASLVKLESLTEEQINRKAAKAWAKDEAARKKSLRRARDIRDKYETMLLKVNAWVCPSLEHIGYHDFMREQLESSIKFDCSEKYYIEPIPMYTPYEWYAKKLKDVMWSIDYNAEEWEKEQQRTKDRNKWIKQLRDSLTTGQSICLGI